jgi:predicted RNase H-like nuclease (RuvC/YqgF family)
MARLKFKQVWSNLQYNTASAQLTLSGSGQGVDFVISGSVYIDSTPQIQKEKKTSGAAEQRQLKKDLTRLDRQLEKCASQIKDLEAQQEAAAFDPEQLVRIESELSNLRSEKSKLEEEWLHTTLSLEN